MKKTMLLALCLCLTSSVALAQDEKKDDKKSDEKPKAKPGLSTLTQRFSYSVGANIGRNMRQQDVELDFDAFIKGLKDALSNNELSLTTGEMQKAFDDFQAISQKKREERRKKQAEDNLKEGAEFLAANKKKEGVKTTKSGLQYKVLRAGKGGMPKQSDTVRTHYRGTLINGTVFDSSYQGDGPSEKDEPVEFGVTQVIGGWTEALQLMKVGAKWRLFIPSTLAYKERGAGRDIGPNATLIFEIELVEIVK